MTNEGTEASVDNVAGNARSYDDLFGDVFGDASDGGRPTTTTTTTTTTNDPFSSLAGDDDDVGNPFGDATSKTDSSSSSSSSVRHDGGDPFGDATSKTEPTKTDITSSSPPTDDHPKVEGNLLGDSTLKVEGSSSTGDSPHTSNNNEGNPFGRSATTDASSDDVRDLRRLLSELAAYDEESETVFSAESRAVRAEQLVTFSAEARRDLAERSGDEAVTAVRSPEGRDLVSRVLAKAFVREPSVAVATLLCRVVDDGLTAEDRRDAVVSIVSRLDVSSAEALDALLDVARGPSPPRYAAALAIANDSAPAASRREVADLLGRRLFSGAALSARDAATLAPALRSLTRGEFDRHGAHHLRFRLQSHRRPTLETARRLVGVAGAKSLAGCAGELVAAATHHAAHAADDEDEDPGSGVLIALARCPADGDARWARAVVDAVTEALRKEEETDDDRRRRARLYRVSAEVARFARRASLDDPPDAERVVSALSARLEAEESRNDECGDNEDNVAAANDAVEAWTALSPRTKSPEDHKDEEEEEKPAVAVATATATVRPGVVDITDARADRVAAKTRWNNANHNASNVAASLPGVVAAPTVDRARLKTATAGGRPSPPPSLLPGTAPLTADPAQLKSASHGLRVPPQPRGPPPPPPPPVPEPLLPQQDPVLLKSSTRSLLGTTAPTTSTETATSTTTTSSTLRPLASSVVSAASPDDAKQKASVLVPLDSAIVKDLKDDGSGAHKNDYSKNALGTTGLVTAHAVDVEDDLRFYEQAPAARAVAFEEKVPLHRNKRVLLYTGLLVFLLIATAVVVATVTAKEAVDMVYTGSPTRTPLTPPPTTRRDTHGLWELLARLSGNSILLARTSRRGVGVNGTAADDRYAALRDAPAYLAADWIVNHDPAEIPVDDERRLEQRYALALLYFSTRGDEWSKCGRNHVNGDEEQQLPDSVVVRDEDCVYVDPYKNSDLGRFVEARFLSRYHECEWMGVQCSWDDKVTEIALYNNNLRGTIPTEIAVLTRLYMVRLNANHLTGTLPSELGTLRHLLDLEVHSNLLTGTLPDEIFRADTLQALNVAMNLFSGTIPDGVANLRSLKGVHLFKNRLTGTIPESLGTLPYLTFAYLHENDLTGPLPSSFHESHSLKEILVNRNRLGGPLSREIGRMKQLEFLDVDNNEFSGTIPDELYDLEHLQILMMESNHLTGTISTRVGQLRSLRKLVLRNNGLTGAIPSELGALPALESAWLHFNDLVGAVPNEVCAARASGTLRQMYADCLDEFSGAAAVACPCCTDCCDRAQETCYRVDEDHAAAANEAQRRRPLLR